MINICQFGAGRIGHIHAANVTSNNRAKLKYIIDVNQESAQLLADKYGASVVSIEQALADSEINGVIIASSTNTHADIIEAAAAAGKAIFCEKPIDLNLKRADEALRAVENAGIPVLLGFNRRFDPSLGSVGEAVLRGDVGQLEMLSIISRDPVPPPAGYIAHSGGLFLDMMIHDFDMAHWILGEIPVEIFARGSNLIDPAIGAAGDIDTAMVTMTTKSGALCQISNSRRATYGYDQRIEAFGSDGMIMAKNHTSSQIETWNAKGITRKKPMYSFLERYVEAFRKEMEHFIDCIEGKATPFIGMHEGRIALALALAAKESLKTGKAITLKI